MTIKVIIADDHSFIRIGVRHLLSKHGDLEIVGEAANGRDLLALVKVERPGLVITDLAMPGFSGIEAIEEVRRWAPGCAVLVFTGITTRGLLKQIDAAGVAGIYLKSDPPEALAAGMIEILAGKTARSQAVLTALAEAEDRADLTGRERQVLVGIARGKTNSEMADQLGISAHTINIHRTNLMRKLDVHSAGELLSVAVRDGLLDTAKLL